MAIRVPVNPETAPAGGGRQLPYMDPGNGANLGAIGDGLRRAGAIIDHSWEKEKEERKKLDRFDLNMRFMRETNDLTKDYEEREMLSDADAPNFAERVFGDYETRHLGMLEEAKSAGFDEDEVNGFALRLTELRGNYLGKAIGFEQKAQLADAETKAESNFREVSRYVDANPQGYASGLAEFTENIMLNPRIPANRKQELIDQKREALAITAAQSEAVRRPTEVIKSLDPSGLLLKRLRPQAITGGRSTNEWANVAIDVAQEFGLNPLELAAIMSFETAGTFSPTIQNDGGYLGLIQFGPAEQQKYGITKSSTPEQWTGAIKQFFTERGLKKGAGIEDVYSTILTGSPGNYDRKDSNGTSVRNAVPRIIKQHLSGAEKWLGAVPGITAPAKAVVAPVEEGPASTEGPPEKTGIPFLDDLTGAQRLQVLQQAYNRIDQDDSETRASIKVAQENAVAELEATGTTAQSVPTREEAAAVFGETAAEQMELEREAAKQAGIFTKGIVTANPASMQAQLEALRPVPGSPGFRIEQARYEAAQRAAAANREAREKDPAAYVISAFPRIQQSLAAADTPAERKAAYARMEEAFNTLGVPAAQRQYFTKEQREAIGKDYIAAGPERKLQMLEGYYAEMGARAGRTLSGGGARDDVIRDYSLLATIRPDPNYRTTFAKVLKGRDLIAKDPARKPTAERTSAAYRGALGTTFNNLGGDYSRMLNESAAAIYVADGGDASVDFDSTAYEAAVKQALGGGGLADFTQGKVEDLTILPPGVNETQFKDWYEGLAPGGLTRLSVDGGQPVDMTGRHMPLTDLIENGVVVMIAPGVYGIKSALDGKRIGSSKGGAFRFRLDKPRMGLR